MSDNRDVLLEIFRKSSIEHAKENIKLRRAIMDLENKKHSVLRRCAFRWELNGEVLSGCYEGMSMDSVCKERELFVLTKINDNLAIVRAENKEGS